MKRKYKKHYALYKNVLHLEGLILWTMIIYNVSVFLDESIEQEWLDWIQVHIPEVLRCNLFKSARFSKILSHLEPNQVSYSIQYLCESQEKLEDYNQNFAAKLRESGMHKFQNKMYVFRTEMEVLGDFFPIEN